MSALQADGRPVFEFLQQPDKGPRGRPPISEGTVHGVEYRGHRRDGTTFPTEISTAVIKDVDGLPRAFMLVGRDITQRKQAEEIMRRQATRLAAMHEIDRAILTARSPEAIARSVLEHLQRILPCDRASVTVFDWPAREMVYLAVEGVASDLTPPGMRAPLSFFPVEDVQDTEAPNMLEDFQAIPNPSPLVRMLASQGLRSWLRVPLHGRGELVGVLTLARVQPGLFTREELEVARELGDTLSVALHNAHLQKHLRRHAMELERRVEERTRELKENMAELESFTYTVSHDLRAPLRAMQGLTQALVEDYGERLDDAGREFATRIMASSHRMEALIRDLLAYSRMGRDEMELHAVPLSQAVEHALTALEHDLAERQARVEVTEPLAVVKGHLATLQQVVQNLVGNAIKFVEPGVQPQVRVWTEPLASGDAVRLWVQDNGIGIEKRYHDRIFRVFERLHGGDTYPGTGIGLAIVHKAVARMGGRAGVDSAPGQGSRFWVELQKVEDEYAR
jgi:signal transduction histidine kinase